MVSVSNIIGDLVTLSTAVDVAFDVLRRSTLLSVIGSRILISMKEAGEKGLNGGTNCVAATMSEMDFSDRDTPDAAMKSEISLA